MAIIIRLDRMMADRKISVNELAEKLDSITQASWQMIPLHVEFQGAHVVSEEE